VDFVSVVSYFNFINRVAHGLGVYLDDPLRPCADPDDLRRELGKAGGRSLNWCRPLYFSRMAIVTRKPLSKSVHAVTMTTRANRMRRRYSIRPGRSPVGWGGLFFVIEGAWMVRVKAAQFPSGLGFPQTEDL
jgi:hypothetical protein